MGTVLSSPMRSLAQPHWNTATIAPYAAATDSRFIDRGGERDEDRVEHEHQQQERQQHDRADEVGEPVG